MANAAARTALNALLPLTLCWGGVASAQQAQPQPAPQTPPAQTQPSAAAGTIAPQIFDLPPQPFSLTPRPRDYLRDDTAPVIGPRALPEPVDNGLSIGPFVIRDDPTPEAGCRWSFRSNRVRFRCRM